jgi:peptidyl-prolyl cis-trans isomerase C
LLGDKSANARAGTRGHNFPKDNAMMSFPSAGRPALPRRAGVLAAALTVALVLAGPMRAQDDPVIAKVNGTEIKQSDLAVAETNAGQIPPMSEAAKKEYLVQFMTDLILLAQAAEAKKAADTEEFKRKLAFERRKLLMQDIMESTGKAALTEAAMRKVYDDAIKQMGQEPEVHARHILVRTSPDDEKASAEAKKKIEATIARLKKGEDFTKLAAEVTEDPSGKANGGDLGYFTKEQMVPEFTEVAFKLDKGQISEPVKTQFGWHVLKVEDKRVKPPPKYEDVKGQLEQFVTRQAQAELVTKLRAEAKVEKFYKTEEPPKADTPEKKQ